MGSSSRAFASPHLWPVVGCRGVWPGVFQIGPVGLAGVACCGNRQAGVGTYSGRGEPTGEGCWKRSIFPWTRQGVGRAAVWALRVLSALRCRRCGRRGGGGMGRRGGSRCPNRAGCKLAAGRCRGRAGWAAGPRPGGGSLSNLPRPRRRWAGHGPEVRSSKQLDPPPDGFVSLLSFDVGLVGGTGGDTGGRETRVKTGAAQMRWVGWGCSLHETCDLFRSGSRGFANGPGAEAGFRREGLVA